MERIDAGALDPGDITPVILCGGQGARLWPLSRTDQPKQFADLGNGRSLFRKTLARAAGPGFAAPVLVTGNRYRFLAAEQLEQEGVEPAAMLIEPEARNTAAAALAAAVWVGRDRPDALVLILPSDHEIADADQFRAAVNTALPAARAGRIVTFGLRPTRPETGYGWLEPDGDGAVVPLRQFVEKPPHTVAHSLLAGGRHLWNMGIVLCRADTLRQAFADHAPAYLAPVQTAIRRARHDLGFVRLDPTAFGAVEPLSLDVAILEKAGNLSVARFDGDWSDMGDWDAIGRLQGGADARPLAIDCQDTVLRSETPGIELVGIGLTNIIAVATRDAVLVADRSRAQDVRLAVAALRDRGAPQADQTARVLRPWGAFEVLTEAEGFKVKRLTVTPGARLSLQSHQRRAEHWVVVSGVAEALIGGRSRRLETNQSTYIPAGCEHRLSNPGTVPAVLIEVQTGAYLGEDDICRLADDYARDAAE